MNRISAVMISATSGLAAVTLQAAQITMPVTKVSMETCMMAALAEREGKVRKVALEIENGVPFYEFAIQGKDQKKWEVECNAISGTLGEVIAKVETKSDPSAVISFEAAAKISEGQAREIATFAHPGEVVNVERKFEVNEKPAYQVKIKTGSGRELEVEVDAVGGKILEVEEDIYEIGEH